MEVARVAGAFDLLLVMRNPFSKPHTPEEWLLSSVCWAVLSIGSWVLLVLPLFQCVLTEE